MNEPMSGTDPALLLDRPPLRIRQCRHGAMLYLTTDQFVGRSLDLYGEFSQGEVTLFAQIVKPGMTVLDLGANIGVHTVYFAQAVGPAGRVVAFEPQRFVHQILCANIAMNGFTNVFAHHAGCAEKAGTIVVPPIDYSSVANFGGLALGGFSQGEPVPLMTVDSLALNACHFIKLDVEGMEIAALEGARATISRHAPLLYVENDRSDRSAALISLLLDLGYRLFWHQPTLFHPDNFTGRVDNVFGSIRSINMLGVPRGTVHALEGFVEITSPDDTRPT